MPTGELIAPCSSGIDDKAQRTAHDERAARGCAGTDLEQGWLGQLVADIGAPSAVAGAVLGALVPWIVLVAANSPMLHPGARALQDGRLRVPDPLTCLPGKCWDGADKWGYPLCTSWDSIEGRIGSDVPWIVICQDAF